MKIKQVVVTRAGGPEVLQVVEADQPEPGPGEVRVKVLATGIAWADTMARRGQYPGAPKMPFPLGYDIVGVVDKGGAGASALPVGQRVGALLTKFGGYAEYVCAPEAMFVPVPGGLEPGAAVSIILNGLTAYDVLHRAARVQAGECILITSAAGGVGSYMVQFAKLAGLQVYGATSSNKLALVAQLGATPIDYRRENIIKRVRELTGGGVEVVADMAGDMQPALAALRSGGRVVSIGGLSLSNQNLMGLLFTIMRATIRVMLTPGKRAMFYGSLPTKVRQDKTWYRETLSQLFNLLAEDKVRAVVGQRLPLVEAVRGHRLIESGAVTGKIVLES